MDNKSSKFINVNNKKCSLGGLFRRKKKYEASESSSEEDRKAGFTPQKRKPKPKPKTKRPNKLINAFDHIIISPSEKSKETDSLKSFDRITTPTDSQRSTGSLDRRLRRERLRAARIYAKEISSDEEVVSVNSSSISRFRSDESLGNHSGSSCKKSRTARTEQYMKRTSKGDELGQIVQQVSRWHTQPITTGYSYEHSINENRYMRQPSEGLRASATLTNVPSQKLNQIWSVPLRNKPQELIKDHANRSISYENHLYRPSSQRITNKTGPLALPPRDPQRRLTIYNLSVLLVTSSRNINLWIVPGVDPGEEAAVTAVREVLEEAGVAGNLGRSLGVFENREHKHRTEVFVMTVTEELEEWEDSRTIGRIRQWFTIDDALEKLAVHKPTRKQYLQELKHTKTPTLSQPASPSS